MTRIAAGTGNPVKPYSPAILDGDRIWTSGQVGYRPDGTLPDDLGEQVRIAMDNLMRVLHDAGAGERDVVAVRVVVTRDEDFAPMDELYRGWFSEPLPARTTIRAALRPGVLFEIDAVASR